MRLLKSSLCLGLSAAAVLLGSCNQAPAHSAAPHAKKAKNIILFIGDGMGISTITAARIFDGQSKGMSGEDNTLSFETFPSTALVKTYNLDSQVADSAGTASAMNTGLKTQIGKINVQPDGLYAGCAEDSAQGPALFADIAEAAGMATGIVSTARITHATPAAVYGRAPNRGWESDGDISEDGKALGCLDLAQQLIAHGAAGGIDVALGGGRRDFIPADAGGKRQDGQNLQSAWAEGGPSHISLESAAELRALNPKDQQSVLGVFTSSHMAFEADRDDAKEPSLTEMTRFAIENLGARNIGENGGYFLMVEAGRIDHAHHATNAYRALTDTQELARAVAQADALTDDEDTLILVTADHSHVFTIAGYPGIGNPILGIVHPIDRKTGALSDEPMLAADGSPYTTLGYHNGPNTRTDDDDLSANAVQDMNYFQQTAVQMNSETHAGEDVALYAKGPGAHRVHGVIDQAEIFSIMADALGLSTDP